MVGRQCSDAGEASLPCTVKRNAGKKQGKRQCSRAFGSLHRQAVTRSVYCLAPVTGLEPVTSWLTATRSTIELHRNVQMNGCREYQIERGCQHRERGKRNGGRIVDSLPASQRPRAAGGRIPAPAPRGGRAQPEMRPASLGDPRKTHHGDTEARRRGCVNSHPLAGGLGQGWV